MKGNVYSPRASLCHPRFRTLASEELGPLTLWDGQGSLDDPGIEPRPPVLTHALQRLGHRRGVLVGLVRGHDREAPPHGEDASRERDLFTAPPLRVTSPVKALVVPAHHIQGRSQQRDRLEDLNAPRGALLDEQPFLGRQGPGLLQQGVWETTLAAVVPESAQ